MPNQPPSGNENGTRRSAAGADVPTPCVKNVSRDQLRGKRVALTGASGFIGGRLLSSLLDVEGLRIRSLSRRAPELESVAAVETVRGDLADAEALRRLTEDADIVIHLAGATRAWTETDFRAANEVGAGAVAQAAAATSSARLVLVSSQAAAGPSDLDRARRESEPPAPVSRYGASKLAGEAAFRDGAGGLDSVVIRPPAVYGPGERDLMELFRMAARGWAPRVGWRARAYSFIHVDDLVAALLVAATHEGACGGTFFAAHPETVTPRSLSAAVAAAVGGRVRSLPLPGVLPRALGWAAGFTRPFRSRPPLLNPDRAREMGPRAWLCDPSAFREATGWSAEIDLAEGTRRTAAWARAEGLLD